MEIYEMIELEDCPRCLGPSILEEENSGYYVMCMDCGCQSATFGFKDDAGRLEAAKEQLNCGMPARLFSTALAIKFEKKRSNERMKSKEELFNMTVLELKEYVNSLSNPEIKEVAEIFEDDEHERDPLELLAAPKLFDYMKYANGTVDIDFSL